MNILLYCNAFLPIINGIVFRIKMFLDEIDKNYKDINVVLVTPNKNTIKNYKRFKIFKISSLNVRKILKYSPDIEVSNPYCINKDYNLVKKICLQEKINLIHIYHGDFFNFMINQISNKYNIPLIISYHTNIDLYLKCYKFNSLYLRFILFFIKYFSVLNKCDMVLNVSKNNEEYLINNNMLKKNQKKDLLPFIVDTNKFYNVKIKRNNNKLKLLSVSRIEKEKNLDILFEAYSKIKNCELHIIGDGSYLKELKNKYNIDNVFFYGKINNEELYKYYSMVDIYINPSKTETMGFTTLEALACKCPVVGFNMLGTKDIIKHNYNGLLFNNLKELINCINLINTNNSLKNRLIQNGYNFIKKYSPENSTKKIISIFKDTIKNKKKSKKKKNLNFLIRYLFVVVFFLCINIAKIFNLFI